MKDQIINFNKQFEFKPEIKNPTDLPWSSWDHYLVCGMGGSHLSADMLQAMYPSKHIIINNDFKLPASISDKTLVILSSFSGNTDETISCFHEASTRGLPILVIASGGYLRSVAEDKNLPYIAMPPLNIQPRMAFGYSLLAFAKALDINLDDINFNPEEFEKNGHDLADKINAKIPIFYSDNGHRFLAEHWKIKFNETAKIPAFYNVIPEMCHNEISMFQQFSPDKASPFIAVFLISKNCDEGIVRRVNILKEMLPKYGTECLEIKFNNTLENICLSDWTSYHLALKSAIDPESIPVIDELKSTLKK